MGIDILGAPRRWKHAAERDRARRKVKNPISGFVARASKTDIICDCLDESAAEPRGRKGMRVCD